MTTNCAAHVCLTFCQGPDNVIYPALACQGLLPSALLPSRHVNRLMLMTMMTMMTMTIMMVLMMMRFLVMTTMAIMVMVMMKLVKGHFCLVGVSTSCTAREEIDSGNVSAQTGGGQRVRWVHFEKRPHPLELARLDAGLLSTTLRTAILPRSKVFQKSHSPKRGKRRWVRSKKRGTR